MLVYEALARILAESGVDTVFYVYGDTNNDLLQTMAGRHDVRLVQARHQSGAVAMADGYARFSNKPGVACVAQGSGFTNSLSSLLTAVNAGSQVLLIAGDTPTVDPMQALLVEQHKPACHKRTARLHYHLPYFCRKYSQCRQRVITVITKQ